MNKVCIVFVTRKWQPLLSAELDIRTFIIFKEKEENTAKINLLKHTLSSNQSGKW